MIASHYAEPLARRLKSDAKLMAAPSDASQLIDALSKGDAFDLLDSARGWAWGYGGGDRRVGYVRAEALGAL